MTFKERLKEAKKMVKQRQKKGDFSLGFASAIPDLQYVSTGIDSLDRLTGAYGPGTDPEYLGVGGIPFGRYSILWGVEGSGKSTLCDRIIARAQEQDKLCLLVDAENRRTKSWMQIQGVNLDTLLWHRGGIMERGLQDLIDLLQLVDFAVVDTVHALVPKAELETGKGAERILADNAPQGRQAAALTKFFRVATARVAEAGTGIILVGQARDATVMQTVIKDLVGGNALKHYATIRLKLSRLTARDKTEHSGVPRKKIPASDGLGGTVEVPTGFLQKILLEKAGTNHREGQSIWVPFLYGVGPDDFKSNIMAAVGYGLIENPSTGRYVIPTADEPVKIHGKDKLIQFFVENTGHYDWLRNSIMRTAEEAKADATQDTK